MGAILLAAITVKLMVSTTQALKKSIWVGADKATVNEAVNQLNLEAGNDFAVGSIWQDDGGSDVDTLNTQASFNSDLVGSNNGEVDGVNYTSFEEIIWEMGLISIGESNR